MLIDHEPAHDPWAFKRPDDSTDHPPIDEPFGLDLGHRTGAPRRLPSAVRSAAKAQPPAPRPPLAVHRPHLRPHRPDASPRAGATFDLRDHLNFASLGVSGENCDALKKGRLSRGRVCH